jgi:hypothetical protein
MSWLTSLTELLGLDNGATEGTAFDELKVRGSACHRVFGKGFRA